MSRYGQKGFQCEQYLCEAEYSASKAQNNIKITSTLISVQA